MSNYHEICLNCMKSFCGMSRCPKCQKTYSEVMDGEYYRAGSKVRTLLPGTMIGEQYYLGTVIGVGGFGVTYIAWDILNSRKVAVKELFPQYCVERLEDGSVVPKEGMTVEYERLIERFENEARGGYELREHDLILKIYNIITWNSNHFYTMEFLDGRTLAQRLKESGPMKWEELGPSMRILMSGLKVLHDNEMIHRDIGPDNIFLMNDGNVRLIDFGSMRNYQKANHFTTVLKEAFAPLELWVANGRQGPWSDIYSLGSTMYYVLSGRRPEKSMDRANRLANDRFDPITPIQTLCPDLPEHVAEAIMKSLELQPAKRPENLDMFSEMLFRTAELEATLQCRKGINSGNSYRIRQAKETLLGRAPSCEIRYPELSRSVSRIHCAFRLDAEGMLCVRDMGSMNGTFIDRERLESEKWKRVPAGSCVRVGNDYYELNSPDHP